jgi:hypothetical protein
MIPSRSRLSSETYLVTGLGVSQYISNFEAEVASVRTVLFPYCRWNIFLLFSTGTLLNPKTELRSAMLRTNLDCFCYYYYFVLMTMFMGSHCLI